MRKTFALFVALAAALPLVAQQAQIQPQPPKAQATSQKPAEMAPYVEKIDVRVISIDVIVTDKKGNRVTGLTKDDFLIYENGIPKSISNFYEVLGEKKPAVLAASTVPAPKPMAIADIPDNQRRRLILYIDNLSLAPFNRNRVFKDMKKFVETDARQHPGAADARLDHG